MKNHRTLVIIRKVGDPRIEYHDNNIVINVNGGTYRDE